MNLIDENEKMRLKSWASKNADNKLFDLEDLNEKESYWISRKDEDSYIIEYDFQNLPEFESTCEKVLKKRFDQEVQRIISIAVFKGMPQEESNINDELPEYRYTF